MHLMGSLHIIFTKNVSSASAFGKTLSYFKCINCLKEHVVYHVYGESPYYCQAMNPPPNIYPGKANKVANMS